MAEGALHAFLDGEPESGLPSEAELDRVHDALDPENEDEAVEVREEPVMEVLMRRVGQDMRAAAPALYEAVRPLLTHHGALTRIRAVEAAAALARLGGLEPDLSGAADMAESRDEGAAIVLALGGSGGDTTEFLTHADPAIRACAALAPCQRGNPVATAELVAALADPAGADAWFTFRPAFFDGHVRSSLVRALADRSGPQGAERLLPVLRAVAPFTTPLTAERDAGPLLTLAFAPRVRAEGPRDPVGDPSSLTDVQRAYLCVLAEADGFWSDRTADFAVVLARLGLPRDREGVRALLDS
ncbi:MULTISPECIES: hypothetical protein [unclassified Nocardiopsis]|uniref:hypothetical protein n=1 Tax=unclassified Nocardiopsis TaxID=2649073 RepID=UPI000B2A90ED|nr:hypothetical protein [Nocardiopsis sp. TSRI0078]